jgi:hypothetical protein
MEKRKDRGKDKAKNEKKLLPPRRRDLESKLVQYMSSDSFSML